MLADQFAVLRQYMLAEIAAETISQPFIVEKDRAGKVTIKKILPVRFSRLRAGKASGR